MVPILLPLPQVDRPLTEYEKERQNAAKLEAAFHARRRRLPILQLRHSWARSLLALRSEVQQLSKCRIIAKSRRSKPRLTET